MLAHFSYGEPFLEINAQLLKRYAACATEEEIKKAEELWLAKIEREYSESRVEDGGGTGGEDAWKGGNMNRRPVIDSDDDEDEDDEHAPKSSDEDGEDGGVEVGDPLGLSEEEEDDEQEMAELRRRVLASKPFSNPSAGDKKPPERIARTASVVPVDSDSESGSESGDNDAFDDIINATPVTDRTGIAAIQKSRRQEEASAVFSRSVVNAPKRW